jgi:hypothetical protein
MLKAVLYFALYALGFKSVNSRRLPAGPSLLFNQSGGKSGQQRAMYRLRAGVITARAPDTDSATENNRPGHPG